MRYYALACDYDGTLAHDGVVDAATIKALERLRESGRHLLLVTGREVEDMCRTFPPLTLFEWVVAENGAVLYNPETRETRLLAEPPPAEFVARLRRANVDPLSVGRVIVATREPHETAVLGAIRDLGLEHQVIFNKGAVMILPAGVNKASGLRAALDVMQLSVHNVVGVGDAENDHAFLSICECGVAVANALPSIKQQADWVTDGARGAGVVQLIERLLTDDLAELAPRLMRRHAIPLADGDGADIALEPYGVNVLLAGTSGGGKSTLATGVLERLTERGYQYCIIDPEGDYENLGEVVVGSTDQPPRIEAVMQLLADPRKNAVINLLGLPLADRPRFFESLLPTLLDLRARTGRPHWLILDEVHHLLPDHYVPARDLWPNALKGLILITVHPDRVLRPLLASVDWLWAIGAAPGETLKRYARGAGVKAPTVRNGDLESGEVLVWARHQSGSPQVIRAIPPRTERKRHHRKYAEGELGEERSFYFRGPDGKLNLRAQNLSVFLQSAAGIDDETWLFHLRRGDYSRWFHDVIKDKALAAAVAHVERLPDPSPQETREFVRDQIERRYTAPA